ncbi:sugar ABC transporter ATP-binding protein [Tolumonas osonensis]|nr:sugar ABC transporter ATP-binding protein [Tolumonas osonensis]
MTTLPENSQVGSFISLNKLSKSFGGHKALNNIDINIMPGEVHCLAGTNGCGKSTLIKVISGVHQPDSGAEIRVNGEIVPKLNPNLARSMGIQVIYQDLSLFPNLSVAENIAFELNMQGMMNWHNKKEVYNKAKKVLEELKFNIDLNEKVEALPIAQRQQVAICRALVADAKLVIMDEPTASLTRTEVNQLLRTVHYLKSKNISVVFVSHRLDEVLEISDTVTVIRDGAKVGSYPANEITPKRLIELMTGVSIEHALKPARNENNDRIILEVENLSRKDQYENISFKLRQGEVLGLCGLLGSGRTELALSLFGITRPDTGKIYVDSKPMNFKGHNDAIKAGIGYVSEDRLTLGLVLQQSVSDNAVLSILDQLKNRMHFIDEYKKIKIVSQWIKDLDIKVSNPDNPISTLSGGNQQKVVLAKWILTQPKVLILDAPTVGVDIAAKDSIYQLIHKLSEQGISILLISDEIPEVYYNCDRILHIDHGHIMNEYEPRKVSETYLEEVING